MNYDELMFAKNKFVEKCGKALVQGLGFFSGVDRAGAAAGGSDSACYF